VGYIFQFHDLLQEKHLVLICPVCHDRILNATTEKDFKGIVEQAQFHHLEHFFSATREHFGLSRNFDSSVEVFIRRTTREPKSFEMRNPDMVCESNNNGNAIKTRSATVPRLPRNRSNGSTPPIKSRKKK
jgi:hypothetical protein